MFVALVLKVGFTFGQTTFTFPGNGSWTKASNWKNNATPPDTIANGSKISISPLNSLDSCILDKRQIVYKGGETKVLNNGRSNISAALIVDNFESYFADTMEHYSLTASIKIAGFNAGFLTENLSPETHGGLNLFRNREDFFSSAHGYVLSVTQYQIFETSTINFLHK